MSALERLAGRFPDGAGYLNTASLGLPSIGGVAAIERHLTEWRDGRAEPPDFDPLIERCRTAYAHLVGVAPTRVGIVSQASIVAGLVASSLPDDTQVLCAEEDFTSVLFPFLADRRLRVEMVPLDRILDAVTPDIALVAVSAVQSADGRRIDLDALATVAADAGARTFVDLTQAAGWLPVDAGRFDVTACSAYKWLSCPRGAGFLTATAEAVEWLVPRYANWYAGDDIWSSIYGPPLRLSTDTRRFDASPAWIAWVGSVDPLEALASVGVDAIARHDVGLVNLLCDRLGIAPADSAIVALTTDAAGEAALRDADLRTAGRAGKVRVSFHHYNTTDDVARLAEALTGSWIA